MIKTIGVPLKFGCDIAGADKGIEKLSIKFDTIIPCPRLENDDSKIKNGKSLKAIFEALKKAIEPDDYPLTLGGDHSLAMGTIAATAPQAIVWVDAHGDINTLASSVSKNVHGMPLAALMGKGPEYFAHLFDSYVLPKNVYIFGARDLDEPEKLFAALWGVNVITYEDILKDGFNASLSALKSKLHGETFHLSVDLDGMDPLEYPFVNLPVSGGGFSKSQYEQILNTLTAMKENVGCDLVEYSPNQDQEGRGADFVKKLVNIVLKNAGAY